MTYEVTLEDRTLQVSVRREGDQFFVAVDGGAEEAVDVRRPQPALMSLLLGGDSYAIGLAPREGGWDVDLVGTSHHCSVVDPRRKALRLSSASAEGTLSTSMPGKVVRLLVGNGDVVTKGQAVVVVEAMKMENEMKAPVGGTVVEVLVAPGEAVEAGGLLLRIEGETE